MIDTLLIHSDFQDSINQLFQLNYNDMDIPLTLIEVKRLRGPQHKEHKRDQFSLLFKGPPTPLMPQHQYTVFNELMGELTLFLVPVGRTNKQHQDLTADLLYEAIFT